MFTVGQIAAMILYQFMCTVIELNIIITVKFLYLLSLSLTVFQSVLELVIFVHKSINTKPYKWQVLLTLFYDISIENVKASIRYHSLVGHSTLNDLNFICGCVHFYNSTFERIVLHTIMKRETISHFCWPQQFRSCYGTFDIKKKMNNKTPLSINQRNII